MAANFGRLVNKFARAHQAVGDIPDAKYGVGAGFLRNRGAAHEIVSTISGTPARLHRFECMGKVLVVDDYPAVSAIMQRALLSDDHDVEFVRARTEALDALSCNIYDCVVSKVLLRDGSSEAIAQAANDKGIPAILITELRGMIVDLQLRSIPLLRKPPHLPKLIEFLQDG